MRPKPNSVQNSSDLMQGKHFQIFGWIERVRKLCDFQRKTDHISETVTDKAKMTINHY